MLRVAAKTASLKRPVDTVLFDTYMEYVTNALLVSHLWQKRFASIAEHAPSWSCDFDTQTLTLGDDHYHISLLGSESYVDDTWLWAWANESVCDHTLFQEAKSFQLLGTQKQISEFQEALLPLTTPEFGGTGLFDGHIISAIASVFHEPPCCYYKAPYEQGAAFLLLHDVPKEVFQSFQVEEVIEGIWEIIQSYPINHRSLIKGCHTQTTIKVEETEAEIRLYVQEAVLHITMDEQDRIKQMSVLRKAAQKK